MHTILFQVLARVDEVLHNLDQLSLCVSLIRQTGAYHRRFQGFKPKYFKVRHSRYNLMADFKNVIPCYSTLKNHFLGW